MMSEGRRSTKSYFLKKRFGNTHFRNLSRMNYENKCFLAGQSVNFKAVPALGGKGKKED